MISYLLSIPKIAFVSIIALNIFFFLHHRPIVWWVIVGPKKDGKLQVVVWYAKHKFGRDNPHIRVFAGLDRLILFL